MSATVLLTSMDFYGPRSLLSAIRLVRKKKDAGAGRITNSITYYGNAGRKTVAPFYFCSDLSGLSIHMQVKTYSQTRHPPHP